MIGTSQRLALLFVALFMVVPITLPPFYGHDMQRLAQVILCLVLVVSNLFDFFSNLGLCLWSRTVLWLQFAILALGFASSLSSHQSMWAFSELALLLACCHISFCIGQARQSGNCKLDIFFLQIIIFLCAVKSAQFMGAGAAAFMSRAHMLDTDLLMEGFSNIRFYGQFQTFTLPILALPLLCRTNTRSLKVYIFALLCCWWMIAICSGTRGTWLGMLGAAGVMVFIGGQGWRWIGWQSFAACVGLAAFLIFFHVLPNYLGLEVFNFAGDRLSTSLSAREIIWHQAWEMIKERPLLGFGPMHFADIPNPVAAHPHQAILQWACEWGIPSTLLVMWLVSKGLWATFRLIRANHRSTEPVDLLRVCLFASLIGALTQSMVDGVIVMPYSQLWLAIVVGWLIGIHEFSPEPTAVRTIGQRGWVAILTLAVAYLGYIAVRDAPNLEEREQAYIHEHGGRFQPRFWMQGVIAQPAGRLLEQTNTDNFAPLSTPK